MNPLPYLFETGESLAVAGMELAKESADKKVKKWSDDCWKLFLLWLKMQPVRTEFLLEQFREFVKDNDLLEDPPSLRAYGFLSKRASKEGRIEFAGMGKVRNKTAHACYASKWIKK